MGKGNRNRTLGDALKNRKRDDVHESVPTAMPSMTTETVDTQAPEILPTAGQRVVFVWGDVNLIGTPSIPMLFWVTDVNPDSGRVAGYAMPSPTLRAMGPQGQSVAMPPLFPAINVAYDPFKKRKLTWHYFSDATQGEQMAGTQVVHETEETEEADPRQLALVADDPGDVPAP
tara:strand:- start:2834 stop:3352 length:519 start_codon:yes stop_codon:yes gene_type:complete